MQGNQSITTYYAILKRLWDELSVIHPIPPCSCDARRLFNNFLESQKVVQFLMGLNEEYNHTKD